jgi:hypothetical protein
MIVLSPARSHASSEAALEAPELVPARTDSMIALNNDHELERSPRL